MSANGPVPSACLSVANPHLLSVTDDGDCGRISDIVYRIRDRNLHAETTGLKQGVKVFSPVN